MPEVEFSQSQIELLYERATKFLAATSQVPSIRVALDRGGYTHEEHAHGWELLLNTIGFKLPSVNDTSATQLRQREATAQLDLWDGPNFERARAALDRHFPNQSAYIFDNLSAKNGADAIATVRTFLDRYAALRDGSDATRSNSRVDDKAAADLLTARRIVDAGEEQRLRGLIQEATSLPDLPALTEPDPALRQQTARKLDAWLRDWRESARVLVTRRDYQIRLGLAERRVSKADASASDGAAPSEGTGED